MSNLRMTHVDWDFFGTIALAFVFWMILVAASGFDNSTREDYAKARYECASSCGGWDLHTFKERTCTCQPKAGPKPE